MALSTKRDPTSHRSPADVARQVKGYNATAENTKKRSQRNQARAIVKKDLGAAALRGKDVDHVRAVRNGGSNARSNLRVRSRSANRAWNKKS
jgi:hypothetical protein